MAKWVFMFFLIVTAVALQAAQGQTDRSWVEPAPIAAMEASSGSANNSSGTRGWLWATPLTLLAVLLQVLCVIKAREMRGQVQMGAVESRAALRYLRFYAEAPVVIGFLGSVCGAILMQLLAAGQMIYFAYVSTASGLVAFLWIQYRYVIEAELRWESSDTAPVDPEDEGETL